MASKVLLSCPFDALDRRATRVVDLVTVGSLVLLSTQNILGIRIRKGAGCVRQEKGDRSFLLRFTFGSNRVAEGFDVLYQREGTWLEQNDRPPLIIDTSILPDLTTCRYIEY